MMCNAQGFRVEQFFTVIYVAVKVRNMHMTI